MPPEGVKIGVCNTILSAYTMYRHLEQYRTHPSIRSFKSVQCLRDIVPDKPKGSDKLYKQLTEDTVWNLDHMTNT